MTKESNQCDNQNFIQLASIQVAGVGMFPNLGLQFSETYGIGTAICSIVVGNLILWLISISIISMVSRSHNNAIDNFRNYLGKYGSMLVSLILAFAFINWFAIQINSTVSEVHTLLQFSKSWHPETLVRWGAGIGLVTAMLATGGIRLIKWVSLCALPLLFLYLFYQMAISNAIVLELNWDLSFRAVVVTVMTTLPGVINLPTFFRHARSKADAFLALTIIFLLITLFRVSAIWMGAAPTPASAVTSSLVFVVGFLVLTLVTDNLLNIYFASACWKLIIPHIDSSKAYAIIGLLGTLVYTFMQISTPVQFFEDLTNCYIANGGVVLVLAYLVRVVVRHRPRAWEKKINFVIWIGGCVAATVYETQHLLHGVGAFLVGINATILLFLSVIFVEETVWAIRMKFGTK